MTARGAALLGGAGGALVAAAAAAILIVAGAASVRVVAGAGRVGRHDRRSGLPARIRTTLAIARR